MMKQSRSPAPAPATPASRGRVGVLLANLGTPDAADARAVRRYLGEFLSDRRVVELPPLLWQPILRGAILTTRPRKSAEAYAQVWSEEGSPLLAITRAQAHALQARLGNDVRVDFGMRYGRPALPERLRALHDAGCDRILVAPLYPQYCAATTATAMDQAYATLAAMRYQPALRTLPPYYDDPAYIAALTGDIHDQLDALPFVPELLLLSFHGMPERTVTLGDPYYAHCLATGEAVGTALASRLPTQIAFQSRFGRAKWIGPATDEMLRRLAAEGVRRVAIAAPGFSADCVETLEELAIRGQEDWHEAGGEDFAVLRCLNAGARGMDMLETLVRRELGGWC